MDDVEKIKQKIDVVDLISEYIPMKKAGRNFKANCPFHNEKSPSFVASPERQMWHCFGCFPPGQKIKTPFGFHNIEDLDSNHWVVSGKGNLKKITQTMVHQYEGEMIHVGLRKLGGQIQLTSDHNVFVIRGAPYLHTQYKNFSKRYSKYLDLKNSDESLYYKHVNKYLPIKEISAGNLRKGDLLLYPIRRTESDLLTIDLKEYLVKKTHYGPVPKTVPFKVKVEDDFLRLLGYYIAEGSNHRAYLRFSLGSHEEEFAQEIKRLVKKLFGITAAIYRRPQKSPKTGIEVTACHSQLAQIFENLCGKGASNKHVPFILQELSPKKQKILLDAVYKGDGTSFIPHLSTNKHKAIKTVSKVLSEQLIDILLRLNIFPTLSVELAKTDKLNTNHREAYTISWSEESKQKYSALYYQPDGSEYWLLPITKLNRTDYSGPVYNFTVEDDHSYIATNFAVSNCGKGGDIFTFVGEYERLDFSESLKVLAEKAGIKLTTSVFKTKTEEKKAKIYAINHLTAQFYNYLLTKHSTGKKALEYLTKTRKISQALLDTFQLGYAPSNSRSLSQYLTTKKGFTSDDLLEAGISFYKNGRLMDFFQNRLMFPISDARGNIIAFSGRALDNLVMPKYINTRETPVYTKGDSLYGIQFAKDSIKKEGKVILMEGEFDVLTSVKEGISNVVAVKGTALTENQIKLLKRFTSKIVFCFDTDAAGVEAQKRSIALIGKEEMNAAVVIPPEGKDADEILNENPLLFKKALKNEVNIYDFIIDSALSEEKATTAEGKKNILQKTLPFLVEIENEIVKEHYLKKIASALDSSVESVMKELAKLSQNTQRKNVEPEVIKQKLTREELIEQHLLTLILQSSNPKDATVLASAILSSIPLTLSSLDKLLNLLKEYFTNHSQLNLQEFAIILPKELHPIFDLCFLTPLPPFTNDEGYNHDIEKTAQEVKILAIKKHLHQISETIKVEEKKEDNEGAIEKLQNEFDSLSSHLKPSLSS